MQLFLLAADTLEDRNTQPLPISHAPLRTPCGSLATSALSQGGADAEPLLARDALFSLLKFNSRAQQRRYSRAVVFRAGSLNQQHAARLDAAMEAGQAHRASCPTDTACTCQPAALNSLTAHSHMLACFCAIPQVAHGPWFQQQDRPFWELKPEYQPEPRYDTRVRHQLRLAPSLASHALPTSCPQRRR